MQFNILNLETNKFYLQTPEHPLGKRYNSGEEAAVDARILTLNHCQKHQPRPITNDIDWRTREHKRMSDTYRPVPWRYANWFQEHYNEDHFLHMSMEKGGYVAFTENEVKGAADRQKRMSAGSYLREFFGHVLTHDQIAVIATDYAADTECNEALFATTQDQIEHVYVNGPNSCMSHTKSHFKSSFHPVRVYAAGDLAVAYVRRHDNITARSVVWPDKKIYTRVYGDGARLVPLLKGLGYSEGNLEGARMLKFEEKGGYVVPYVDATGSFDACDTHLILTDDGDYSCSDSEPVGISPWDEDNDDDSDDDRFTCERCQARADSDYSSTIQVSRRSTELWCDPCATNHATYCDVHDITVPSDQAVEMADGRDWPVWKFETDGFVCQFSGEKYADDDLVVVTTRSGKENWGQEVADQHATMCAATDEYYHNDALVTLSDGLVVGFDTSPEAIEVDTNGTSPHKPSPTMPHPDQIEMEAMF